MKKIIVTEQVYKQYNMLVEIEDYKSEDELLHGFNDIEKDVKKIIKYTRILGKVNDITYEVNGINVLFEIVSGSYMFYYNYVHDNSLNDTDKYKGTPKYDMRENLKKIHNVYKAIYRVIDDPDKFISLHRKAIPYIIDLAKHSNNYKEKINW